MLRLFKQNYQFLRKNFSTCEDLLLMQCLRERSLLRISGNDSSAYLQGLITNDMKHLEDGASSMYTMFLNSKGRVLYDSIIYKTDNNNTYLIECDAEASSPLRDHLLRYKVRRKVSVDCLNDEFDIWSVVTEKTCTNLKDTFDYKIIINDVKQKIPELLITNDPRLTTLGLRVITAKDTTLKTELEKNTTITAKEENFYKSLRYKLGIGEGLQELPSEKCFPMEVNGDYLHGISFHKGCYIGQELTARTYHTGVIRKRLMPLVFDDELRISEFGIPIYAVADLNKSVGKLQGIERGNGLGLMRIEEALKADELVVSDVKCKTHRPLWWPTEAPKERMKIG